jgi:hypothetical protein
MAKIYKIVTIRAGNGAPKNIAEARAQSEARGDGLLMVPDSALLLSVLGGKVELAQGGVK